MSKHLIVAMAKERAIVWLMAGKYRSIQHRHDGSYLAKDEAAGDEYHASGIVELAEMLRI